MQFALALNPRFHCHPAVISLALLLFSYLAIPAEGLRAETLPASSFFEAARKSFQARDYDQALSFFKQARASGLNKPALFYNIGVCSYRLGLYEEATQAFLHTATFPKMAALAYYNLAVVAEKQGDIEAAISWLKKVPYAAGERDEKLMLLAQTALSRIKSRQGTAGVWSRFVSLGFGYDDNVTMMANDDLELTSEEADSFTDVLAFVSSPLLGESTTQGPFLQGSLSFRDYTDLHEYDTGTLRLDGRYRKNAGDFKLEGGAGYNYVLWDYAGYCQSPIFSMQAKRPIGDASSFRLHYEAIYLDMLSASYDYLQGWQHRATAEFSTSTDSYRLLLGYSLEENDRHDKESSPRRHLIRAALEFYPLDRFAIIVAGTYRDSTYDLSGHDSRNDDRYETSLLLSYALAKKWELSALASHTINISTSTLYDYRRNMASINLGYSF